MHTIPARLIVRYSKLKYMFEMRYWQQIHLFMSNKGPNSSARVNNCNNYKQYRKLNEKLYVSLSKMDKEGNLIEEQKAI